MVLNTRRTTEGVVIATGEKFSIVDDYGDPSSAHRVLPNAWRGTTTFTVKKADVIDGAHVLKWADVEWDSEAEFAAPKNAPVAAPSSICSLIARPPAQAGDLDARVSSEKRRDFACGFTGVARTESVGSHHLGGKSDCKFESHGPRSGLCATNVQIANRIVCQVPISSPASSRWTGDVRGGVRESDRQIMRRRHWHVHYGHFVTDRSIMGIPSQICPLQSGSSETHNPLWVKICPARQGARGC